MSRTTVLFCAELTGDLAIWCLWSFAVAVIRLLIPPHFCDKLSEPAAAFHVKASQGIAIDPLVEPSADLKLLHYSPAVTTAHGSLEAPKK